MSCSNFTTQESHHAPGVKPHLMRIRATALIPCGSTRLLLHLITGSSLHSPSRPFMCICCCTFLFQCMRLCYRDLVVYLHTQSPSSRRPQPLLSGCSYSPKLCLGASYTILQPHFTLVNGCHNTLSYKTLVVVRRRPNPPDNLSLVGNE